MTAPAVRTLGVSSSAFRSSAEASRAAAQARAVSVTAGISQSQSTAAWARKAAKAASVSGTSGRRLAETAATTGEPRARRRIRSPSGPASASTSR